MRRGQRVELDLTGLRVTKPMSLSYLHGYQSSPSSDSAWRCHTQFCGQKEALIALIHPVNSHNLEEGLHAMVCPGTAFCWSHSFSLPVRSSVSSSRKLSVMPRISHPLPLCAFAAPCSVPGLPLRTYVSCERASLQGADRVPLNHFLCHLL